MNLSAPRGIGMYIESYSRVRADRGVRCLQKVTGNPNIR